MSAFTRSRSPQGSNTFGSIPNGTSASPSPASAYAALAAYAAEQEYKELSNSDLSDRIILVVGATVDVAAATAVRLSKHGAQLILLDQSKNRDRLNSLAAQCDASALHGNKWQFRANKWQRVQKAHVTPLESTSDLKVILDNIVDTFGRIDGLVFKSPNPQVAPSFGGGPSNGSIRDGALMGQFDRSIEGELLLLVRLIQLIVPHLEQSGGGQIVNVSTTVAMVPDPGQLASAMTRTAIDMLIKCISLELGPKKIRVNSVNHVLSAGSNPQSAALANGLEVNQSMVDQYLQQIEKDHVGQRRLRSEDVASAVLYLLSPRSAFLNGANLVVDGGKIHMSQA